jgi:hypothetical protein
MTKRVNVRFVIAYILGERKMSKVKAKKQAKRLAKEQEMETFLLKYNWTKSQYPAFDQNRRCETWYLDFFTPSGEKTIYRTLTQAYKMQYSLAVKNNNVL